MANWRALLDNPAVVIGLARAVVLFLVSMGIQITADQQNSVYALLGALMAFISILFTAATVAKTQPRPADPEKVEIKPEGEA